jgi:hypothetical protein
MVGAEMSCYQKQIDLEEIDTADRDRHNVVGTVGFV